MHTRLAGCLLVVAAVLAVPCRSLTAQEKPAEEPPPVPKGVEVLARGPVHEAFATPTSAPQPTPPVAKAPPKPLEELPPEEKPEGDAEWIGGYWAFDEERKDYLWVTGVWRVPPPGKAWVAGYWREENGGWQWVPGFWNGTEQQGEGPQQVTYLPSPPTPPEVAPPGQPPTAESFYVPGHWVWTGTTYAWRAGYWGHVQPGYVWVPAHYCWTPSGYVFVPGYWDLTMARRGVLYAPVIVDPVVVGPTFVYTPVYVVQETVVLDSLFVRPCCRHYYFGDYYGPVYRDLGYESCVVYSRRSYDPIFVYERWEHRHEPAWESLHIEVCLARHAGRAPCPPRTLVQQNVIVQNNITNVNVTNVNVKKTTVNQVLVPAKQHAAAKGVKTVALDQAARTQVKQQAAAVQQVAKQRSAVEVKPPANAPAQPRVAALNVPKPKPAAPPVVAKTPAAAPGPVRPAAHTAPAPGPNKPGPAPQPRAPVARPTAPSAAPAAPAPPRPLPPGMPKQAAPLPPRPPQPPRPQPRPEAPPKRPPAKDGKDRSRGE